MKRIITTIALFLTVPVLAQNKEPRIVSRSKEVFNNTTCTVTDTCDLKQVRNMAEDYEIFVEGSPSYGTRLFAWYITDTIASLENYAFVQFIKGCQYQSTIIDNEVMVFDVARDYFGEQVTFNHPEWMIDTIDTDPAYFSSPDSRHFNYKWNTKPGSTNKNTEKSFGLKKPVFPELYIFDHPGTAFYLRGTAKNISLAFKTCLYKTSDVPIETFPDNVDFGEPIHCFYWYSSWVYSHDTENFEHPYDIAPACNK